MQMQVEIFKGKTGLLQLASAWRSLTGRLENRRHFHCIEWYLALAETFETHANGDLICVGIFSSNELVAVFPFRVVCIHFADTRLRALELLSDASGHPTARDFIIASSLATSDFFQDFVHFLDQNDQSWDVISLRGILKDSFAFSALKFSSSLPVIKTPGGPWGRIEFISCGDDANPFERLSKGFRQNLRTAHNKLKSGSITFVSARKPKDLLALYPDFLQIESSGWKGALGTSVLQQPVAASFHHNLISNFGPLGECEIYLMKVENQPAAGLFCITTNDICYLVRVGYNEAFAIASPGHLILEHLLKNRGMTGTINIVTPYNAPPWFKAWKPDMSLGIYNVYVFRPSRRGYALANQFRPVKTRKTQRIAAILWRWRTLMDRLSIMTSSYSKPAPQFTFGIRPGLSLRLIDEAICDRAFAASHIRCFPVDLDPRLDSEGIHDDGWVGSRVQFTLASCGSKVHRIVVRGSIPAGAEFGKQRVSLTVKEKILFAKQLEAGEFAINVPVDPGVQDITLEFAAEGHLPNGDGRPVSALLKSIVLK